MITYLGSLSIGACIPTSVAVIATAYADLQARVDELLEFQPTITPLSFNLQLDLLAQMTLNIQAMISLGVTLPSVQLQIDACIALVLALEAELAIILNLQLALAQAGVFAYSYVGRTDAFGGELATVLAGGFPGGAGFDHTNALVLATTTPACWASMQLVFKTTP